jgi:hypothetical protein
MNPVRLDPQGPFSRARFLHPIINKSRPDVCNYRNYLDPNAFERRRGVAQQLPRRLRKSRITDDSDQVRC